MPETQKKFPLPSSLKVAPGTEAAQAAYPYYQQFEPEDDERFWFYNSMHFPEPMTVFDMVTQGKIGLTGSETSACSG